MLRKLRPTRHRKGVQQNKTKLVLLTAFPKSASRHMLYQLETSFRDMHTLRPKIDIGYGNNFLSINKINRKISPGKTNIIYGHYPLNQFNRNLLAEFPDKHAIILIRALPDVVISYREHVLKKQWGPLDWGVDNSLECHPDFCGLDSSEQYDLIIRFVLPWYTRYLLSWILQQAIMPVRIITFEGQTLHTEAAVSVLGRYLGLQRNDNPVPEEDEGNGRVNYNQGISGRGKKFLSESQINEIERLVATAGMNRYPVLNNYLLNGYSGADSICLFDDKWWQA